MALATGGDLIGEGESQEKAEIGDTPHLAARLAKTGRGERFVIASNSRRLLGGLFELTDRAAASRGIEPTLDESFGLDQRQFEALLGTRLIMLVGPPPPRPRRLGWHTGLDADVPERLAKVLPYLQNIEPQDVGLMVDREPLEIARRNDLQSQSH